MREVVFHRRARRYLGRMPKQRAVQVLEVIEEVAGLVDITEYVNLRALTGELKGGYRIRVGVYRSVVQVRMSEGGEILYVDFVGPRGGAYS